MGPLPVVGGGLGLVVLLLSLLFGGDVLGGGGSNGFGAPAGAPDPNDDAANFVGFVTSDVQRSWSSAFSAEGKTYVPTKLVLFSQATSTGCGNASASPRPLNSPGDRKV
jgi:predicted metalloprotease